MKPLDIRCPTCHMNPGAPCVGIDLSSSRRPANRRTDMTDITPEQRPAVGRLEEWFNERPDSLVANDWSVVRAALAAEHERAARAEARLADAPHEVWCATKDSRRVYEFAPCDCWKSEAVSPFDKELGVNRLTPTDLLMSLAAERDMELVEDWDPSRPDETALPRPHDPRR